MFPGPVSTQCLVPFTPDRPHLQPWNAVANLNLKCSQAEKYIPSSQLRRWRFSIQFWHWIQHWMFIECCFEFDCLFSVPLTCVQASLLMYCTCIWKWALWIPKSPHRRNVSLFNSFFFSKCEGLLTLLQSRQTDGIGTWMTALRGRYNCLFYWHFWFSNIFCVSFIF